MRTRRAVQVLFLIFFWLFAPSGVNAQYPYSLERSNVKVSYELDTLEALNSSFSEFSPVVHKQRLLFTSDRHSDLLNRNMESWSRNAYLSLFWIELGSLFDSVAFREVTPLSNKINVRDHTGPLAFSPDHSTAIFTRVGEEGVRSNGKKMRKPALFRADLEDGEWGNIERLSFADKKHVHAHPSFMGSDDRLVFTSDRDGGPGKTDLFVSKKKDGEWSEPRPLPEGINSPAKEAFPYSLDSAIFFASDRDGGHGGYDLYCSLLQDDGEWGEPHHLDRPLNSEGDDFGMMLRKNREDGYVSSDRKGGFGEDDIYELSVIEKVIVQKKGLAGRFKYRKLEGDYAEGKTVELVDDEGNVVMRTQTDSSGKFQFEELPSDKNVSVRLKDRDADVELVMTGDKSGVQLMKDDEGRFVYRKLEGDRVGTQQLKQLSDPQLDSSVADLSGKFVYERLPSKKAGERTLELVDENGVVARTKKTDEEGNFEFEELPSDKNYRLRLKEVPDEDMKLLVFDGKGKVVAELKSGENGVFDYRKLGGDQADEELLDTEEPQLAQRSKENLYGKFEYKKLEGDVPSGMRIKVLNDEGKVQFVSKADSAGYFRMVNMELADSMVFDIKSDQEPKGEMVAKIMDRYGNVKAVLHKNENGFFVYRRLEGDEASKHFKEGEDESELAVREGKDEEKEESPEEKPEQEEGKEEESSDTEGASEGSEPDEAEKEPKKELKDRIRIRFEHQSSYLSQKGKERLDEWGDRLQGQDVQVRVEGHASGKGPSDFNEWLSKRRAKRVRDHLLNAGLEQGRIEIEWYGEDRLLNDCEQADDCSEAEHAKNRRVELSYR